MDIEHISSLPKPIILLSDEKEIVNFSLRDSRLNPRRDMRGIRFHSDRADSQRHTETAITYWYACYSLGKIRIAHNSIHFIMIAVLQFS